MSIYVEMETFYFVCLGHEEVMGYMIIHAPMPGLAYKHLVDRVEMNDNRIFVNVPDEEAAKELGLKKTDEVTINLPDNMTKRKYVV